MSADSLSLEKILDLEQLEVWTYRGFSWRQESIRVFGGQVAGQALAAAGRTVEAGRRVHSRHAYFLRPGDTGAPLLYEVEPVRDGRTFSTRRVLAVQHGEVIFSLSASFAVTEDGIEHQRYQPAAPGPDDSADAASVIAAADPATRARSPTSRTSSCCPPRCRRTAWSSAIPRSPWPASITSSGSMRRSGPTTGCCTSRRATGPAPGGRCAEASSSTPPACSLPRCCRKGWCGGNASERGMPWGT